MDTNEYIVLATRDAGLDCLPSRNSSEGYFWSNGQREILNQPLYAVFKKNDTLTRNIINELLVIVKSIVSYNDILTEIKTKYITIKSESKRSVDTQNNILTELAKKKENLVSLMIDGHFFPKKKKDVTNGGPSLKGKDSYGGLKNFFKIAIPAMIIELIVFFVSYGILRDQMGVMEIVLRSLCLLVIIAFMHMMTEFKLITNHKLYSSYIILNVLLGALTMLMPLIFLLLNIQYKAAVSIPKLSFNEPMNVPLPSIRPEKSFEFILKFIEIGPFLISTLVFGIIYFISKDKIKPSEVIAETNDTKQKKETHEGGNDLYEKKIFIDEEISELDLGVNNLMQSNAGSIKKIKIELDQLLLVVTQKKDHIFLLIKQLCSLVEERNRFANILEAELFYYNSTLQHLLNQNNGCAQIQSHLKNDILSYYDISDNSDIIKKILEPIKQIA